MVSWTIGPDRFATVWRGRAGGWRTSVWMAACAGCLAFASFGLITLAFAGSRPLGALTVVAIVPLTAGGLLCLGEAAAAGLVVTRVSGYSVQVRPGLLPVGGMRIPVRDIRVARVIDAAPRRPYGWGWWCGRGARSVVVRSGPSLALDLYSLRTVVISVDRPEVAALVLRRVGPRIIS